MNEHTPSIRSQLILQLAILLTILSLITGLLISYLITDKATKVFDHSLLAATNSIAQRLSIRDGKTYLHMPYFVLDIMQSTSGEKIFYRIQRSDGEILAGFSGLAFPQGYQQSSVPIFYSTEFAGNQLRAVYLPVLEKTLGETKYTHIILAESLHGRSSFSAEILAILAVVTFFGVILSIVIAVFAVNNCLSPLRKIRQSLITRSMYDLAPLNTKVPKEVEQLIASINQLMTRLREGIEHIQHFNSDVSHQLRTPLAEIKTLAEVASSEFDQTSAQSILSKINQRADFLIRTTQQLLIYAKTNKSFLDNSHLTIVDLTKLCRDTAANLAPAIYKKGQQLAFITQPNQAIYITGDPIILEGLVINLIENASLYSDSDPSPTNDTITIKVFSENCQAILEIIDQGPGIAEDQLAKVTQRFYRLDRLKQGSGLGLAIVRQICDFHQATLQLSNSKPHGLKVRIAFALEEKPTATPQRAGK
ncbi:MAG: hypothetical protein OFPII_29790 [Osedax symbiont Rs1]|nr:MAG: hypothetical protein OFPII_29790 [Osedax symbiont Rs1]